MAEEEEYSLEEKIYIFLFFFILSVINIIVQNEKVQKKVQMYNSKKVQKNVQEREKKNVQERKKHVVDKKIL